MFGTTTTRRIGFAGALGLAMAFSAAPAAFAQSGTIGSSPDSISGAGDDAQSNSTTPVAPGTVAVQSGTVDTGSTNSISGNGDDAQSNSLGSQSSGTGAAAPATQDCSTVASASGVATTCNQQSGDDAESASGLPTAN